MGSMISGFSQGMASKEAAKSAQHAAEYGAALQYKQFRETREDLAPWTEAGQWAVGELKNIIGAGPGEFVPEEEPGYKFGYEEFVEKPAMRGAAAKGRLLSGATGKALTRYASDYASTQYDNWLNRYLKELQPYQSLAGLGQTGAIATGQLGGQAAQGMAQNILAGGKATAQGYLGMGQGFGAAAGGGASNILDSYLMNKMGLFGSGTTGGGGSLGTPAGSLYGTGLYDW